MTVLYEDDWATLTLEAGPLVRYTRTAKPYKDLVEVESSFGALRRLAAPIPPGAKLLIDIRLAPPRNDEGFEARSNIAVEAFAKRFVKIATLVRTAVGKLQAVRMAHERGAEPHAFDSERAALEYLGVL